MAKPPRFRMLALAVVIAIGLALFFWFGPETPTIVRPADTELTP